MAKIKNKDRVKKSGVGDVNAMSGGKRIHFLSGLHSIYTTGSANQY